MIFISISASNFPLLSVMVTVSSICQDFGTDKTSDRHKGAPAFHTSDSWEVREDRLSTPLTGIYNVKDGQYLTVIRKDEFCHDALTTHSEGEVILSGKTSIGLQVLPIITERLLFPLVFPIVKPLKVMSVS